VDGLRAPPFHVCKITVAINPQRSYSALLSTSREGLLLRPPPITFAPPATVMSILIRQTKFAATSSIATLVDYVLYLVLVHFFLNPVLSNLISYGTAILINFQLQKKFIFILRRKVTHAFMLSLSFSLIGLALSTLLIFILTRFSFFQDFQFLTKLIVTGIIFFYNFFTKQFAFEK
jgi:putative flippase GtrA